MSQEEKNIPVEQQRLEKEQIEDMGSVYRTRGAHAIQFYSFWKLSRHMAL